MDRPHDGAQDPGASEERTLVVSPDGEGTHRTLAEAVADAGQGMTIRLSGGTHPLRRGLLIREGVMLAGEGMDLTEIVCDRGDFALRYEGTGLFGLRDLAVRWAGQQGRPADVVSVMNGEVLIEGCRFTGATWRERLYGAGLELKGRVTGAVRRCQVQGNGYGIVVGEDARPLLEGNTCRQNEASGIACFARSAAVVRRNRCTNNVDANGIYVLEKAKPMLEENVCRENKFAGIAYFDQSGGVARANSCVANGMGGFIVTQDARPELDGNLCREHKYCGIIYGGRATGFVHHNTCTDNGLYGIWLGERSRPKLEANTCEGNPRAGIYVTVEAWPVIAEFPGWDLARRPWH